MSALRIALANITLASRTGTETHLKDLAIGLKRRGHTPLVYSPKLGEIAAELRAVGVSVFDRAHEIPEPVDVIHGNHVPVLLSLLLRFGDAPAVSMCHDRVHWCSGPLRHTRVLRYIAVDDNCRERLNSKPWLAEHQVQVILNSVDLQRFQPRPALPDRPRRALLFSNYARESTHLPAVRRACARAGLELDVVGEGVATATSRPELLLPRYDIVFAKARCALEAMAVGAAVVLCDFNGVGPMVTARELSELRRLNFGMRTMQQPLGAEALGVQIARYDSGDATEVSRWIRKRASLEQMLDAYEALYDEVAEEHRAGTRASASAEGLDAARAIEWLTEIAYEAEELRELRRSRIVRLRERVMGSPRIGPLAARIGRWTQWPRNR